MRIPFSKHSFEYDRLPIASNSNDEHPQGSHGFNERRIRCSRVCNSAWPLVLLALSISLVGNVAIVLLLQFREGPHTFYPKGREIHILFDPESPYNESSSEISDQAWKDLTPKKGGYIAVNDEDKARYGLLPTEMRNGKWVYGVTVFHQLHCLQMLRSAHYKSLAMGTQHDSPETQSEGRMHHYDHCFDFIRQALMCKPDTTLEPVTAATGGLLADTGRGVMHSCSDFKDVLWFAGQHALKNYPAN